MTLSPVPDWPCLQITKADVVATRKSANIIGFVLWVNLGIRIGFFVAPNPRIALSFNDSCDEILRQARAAEGSGTLEIAERVYLGRATPKEIATINWFD